MDQICETCPYRESRASEREDIAVYGPRGALGSLYDFTKACDEGFCKLETR